MRGVYPYAIGVIFISAQLSSLGSASCDPRGAYTSYCDTGMQYRSQIINTWATSFGPLSHIAWQIVQLYSTAHGLTAHE